METTNNKGAKISLNSVGSLFGDSYKFYKERFSVLTEIVLLPVLIVLLGYALIFIGSLVSVVGLLVLLAGGVVLIFSTLALVSSVHNNTGVDDSYRNSAKFFWPYIWMSILSSLAIFGGMVMLIIPGICLAIAFSLKTYTLVLENRKGLDGLYQSKEYIKGYWWAFLGRMVLLLVVFGIASLILNVLFGGMGKFGGTLASLVIVVFLVPFSSVFFYKIYQNLKTLKPELEGAQHKSGGFVRIAAIVGLVLGVLFAAAIILHVVAAVRNGSFSEAQNHAPMIPANNNWPY